MFFLLLCFFCCCFSCLAQQLPHESISLKFATYCQTPNGDMGFCMELEKCPIFDTKGLLETAPNFDFLKASDCTPSNAKLIKVCCGKYSNFNSQHEKAPPNVQTALDQQTPEEILPEDCGKHKILTLANRIFGGKASSVGEFPWTLRLLHRNKHGYRNYGCSAFLIHRKFALTAAHCVGGVFADAYGPVFQVVAGEHDVATDIDCSESRPPFCADLPVYVNVAKPIVFHGYDNFTHDHDLALIPLKQPIAFSDFIQPICISENSTNLPIYWLSGWGKTENASESLIKLKVALPKVPFEDCVKKYETLNVKISKRGQMCAGGEEGFDSCFGDSGGPLMGEINGKWFAEGIVSFGYGCGRKGWPGVYTHIPKYLPWIKKIISRKLDAKSPRPQS